MHYIFIQKIMQYYRQLPFSSLFAEAIINVILFHSNKEVTGKDAKGNRLR